MTELKNRKPIPVLFGSLKMYCEKMKFSAETLLYESPTVTGATTVTGKFRKMTRMTFSGRVYNDQRPLFSAGIANNINGTTGCNIVYRDLQFPNCTITGFSADDSGEDYIYLTVTAATSSSLIILNGVNEQ